MPTQSVFNLQGLQLGASPFLSNPGEFIHLVNLDSDPVGAKRKRPGYTLFQGTADGSAITSLFEWHKDDGTTLNLYRFSGTQLYYSAQGTTDWVACGNGGFTAGSPIGNAVLNNTLIIGNGVDATRHSTDGTSFTNTTAAPIAARFTDYQNRIYAIGTTSTLFYSTTGDATNWSTSGTSDSSSLTIPGPGKLLDVYKVADRVVTTKNSGLLHRWDGYSLVDTATKLGYSSPYSVGSVESFRIGLNRLGYFGYNGASPTMISNDIQRQIYNDSGTAIVGSVFDSAPAGVYKYNYMCAVGTVTDDITFETVRNCLQTYDFQLDQWSNYGFGTMPTAFVNYKDNAGNEQLLLGDNAGQCYQFGGTALSDNNLPIEAIAEFIYHDGVPHLEKKFNYAYFFFNPGCQAKVQIATGDTYAKGKKNWVDLGDASSGVVEYKFSGDRGRLLFIRISESSTNSRFSWYGCAIDYDPIER